MITELILNVLFSILNILLSPLNVINMAVDFVGSMPVIYEFLEVVAYILPWSNLLPLITMVVSIFLFRIVVSLVKTLWQLIPIL